MRHNDLRREESNEKCSLAISTTTKYFEKSIWMIVNGRLDGITVSKIIASDVIETRVSNHFENKSGNGAWKQIMKNL